MTSLGRPSEPPLSESHLVSLWHTRSQERVASALVGPGSRVEGFYSWEPLLEPVVLRKGQEYRLSQRLVSPTCLISSSGDVGRTCKIDGRTRRLRERSWLASPGHHWQEPRPKINTHECIHMYT